MAERWVVNASPIIALGSIGKLDLMASLADEVVVPEAVAQEVHRCEDEASRALTGQGFSTKPVESDVIVDRWGLGPGETSVLSFARSNTGYVAVLDDLAARRCASALGIATRGTVGAVLLAKTRGLIPSVATVLAELRAAGLYVTPSLVAAALSLAGESSDD